MTPAVARYGSLISREIFHVQKGRIKKCSRDLHKAGGLMSNCEGLISLWDKHVTHYPCNVKKGTQPRSGWIIKVVCWNPVLHRISACMFFWVFLSRSGCFFLPITARGTFSSMILFPQWALNTVFLRPSQQVFSVYFFFMALFGGGKSKATQALQVATMHVYALLVIAVFLQTISNKI